MRFADKSVLVTGGATGIGFAIAERFASEGAKVVIVGKREEVGQAAASKLQSKGLHVRFIRGDVSVEEDVYSFIRQTIELHGKLDILVNNAAAVNSIKFIDEDTAKWQGVFNSIVQGAYYCSRTAANHMIAQGIRGHIINISSINGYRALEYSSHYNSAKGAMDQMTRCMALELMEHGIRVNGIGPGFIDTPMSVVDGENELDSDWFQSIYVGRRKIPQQRAGQPEEVAGVAAFLASPDASYLCGAIIPVDGGLSITF